MESAAVFEEPAQQRHLPLRFVVERESRTGQKVFVLSFCVLQHAQVLRGAVRAAGESRRIRTVCHRKYDQTVTDAGDRQDNGR